MREVLRRANLRWGVRFLSTNENSSRGSVPLNVLRSRKVVPIDPSLEPAVERVSGMAMDSQGDIFLSDEYNHRIVKLSASGDVLWAVGAKGKGEGSFFYPRGLTILEELAQVLICDSWNHRITALDLDGNLKFSFGHVGSGAGQFYEPQAICATAADELIVVDRGNHRLQRFSSDGKFKGMVGRRGSVAEQEIALLHDTPAELFSPPCFLFPSGVAPLSSDSVSVLDAGNRRVLIFTDQLELVSEYELCDPAEDGRFAPAAIAANDVGFFFLLDDKHRTIQQVAPPGLPIVTFEIEASQEQGGLQPQLLATAGGLVVVNAPPCELSFFELEQSSLKDAILNASDAPDKKDAAVESLIEIGVKRGDADLVNQGVSGAVSREAASFASLRAAAWGLMKLEQPLNLYLLLSRAVQAANSERERNENEQIELLRELEPKMALSANETVACEAALIADDASPHSVSEGDAVRDYQATLLQLKLLMAKEKRQTNRLIELVRDAAVLYRRRELWEAFEFCLGVLLQAALKEAESLKDSLLGIRNRLGEMVGLCKSVMADSPEQQAVNRFVYLGRYRAVLEANRGLYLGALTRATDSIGVVLGEQLTSSAASARFLERTDRAEQEFVRRLLDSAAAVFAIGGADPEVLDTTGRLIWTLLRSYPGLRKLASRKDAFEALGYDPTNVSVETGELERFVYAYLFSKAVDGDGLIGAPVFDEAASVAWDDVNLSDILEAIRNPQSPIRNPQDGRANNPLDVIKQVRDSIVTHGQSWARVILESYMRLAGLRASPRAIANKALVDFLVNRQRDCYGTIFNAHRMSLEGSSQLLKLLVAGVVASGDEKLISQVGKELSTTRLVEVLERLASNVCPPLTDKSGKPVCDSESLTNLRQRNEVLDVVLNALNRVRMLFANSRFHLSLAGAKFGIQLGDDDGVEWANKGTADLMLASSENYVRCQHGLREWLWSHWGKESLGSREGVLDPKLQGEVAVSNVLLADRAMRTGHFLKALHWMADELEEHRKRLMARTGNDVSSDEKDSGRLGLKIKLPRKLLRATFHLYCDPSTRDVIGDFWRNAYGGRAGLKSDGGWLGLAAAAESIGSRTSLTSVRTQADDRSDRLEFLDAMAAWMQKTCAYCVDLAKRRANQRDESGEAFKPVPFVDGAKDSVADLHFSSCYEAVLTTVSLAVSSGLDAASVSGWDPEAARASLEVLVADISSIDVPDNLCDWARGNVARILSIYRTFFGQLRAVNDVMLASAEEKGPGLDETPALTVSEPGESEAPLTFLPRLILDNYHFALGIARAARTAREISRRRSSVDSTGEEFIRWIDATSAVIDVSLSAIERSRQTCWSQLRGAMARAAEAVASRQWAPRVAELGWKIIAELLSEMADAAAGVRSRLEELRGELVLGVWSPQAGPEDRDQFFQRVEQTLHMDPTRDDIRRKLGEIILLDESDAQDVKRAVRLRARYSVRLVDRIRPGLVQPYGIISDASGGLLIADFGNGRIGRLDRASKFLEILVVPQVPGRSGPFVGPFCLARWNDSVWCSFAQGDLLIRYDERLDEVRRLGPAIGKLKLGRLFGLAADEARNQLYVADHDGNCIWTVKQADKSGEFTMAKSVAVDGPLGVAVDTKGRVAVSLQNKSEVHLFDASWELIGVLEGFSCPHLVTFGADSSLFVADTRNNCVKRFSEGGDLIYSIPMKAPAGVWVDGGELLVTSVDTGELSIYSISAEI